MGTLASNDSSRVASTASRVLGGRMTGSTLAFITVMVSVVVLVVFGGTAYLNVTSRTMLEAEALRVTALMANQVKVDVARNDVDAVLVALQGTTVHPDLRYAVVRRHTGEIIAGRDTRRYWKYDTAVEDSPTFWHDAGVLHVLSPVPGAKDGVAVQLGYSLESLSEARRAHIVFSSAVAVCLSALGVVLVAVARTRRRIARAPRRAFGTASGTGAHDPSTSGLGAYDREFLAYIGHELRTPLSAIIGYAEMVQEDAIFMEQLDFVPDLKKIQSAGGHLLALVDDIVDLLRLRSGQLNLTVRTFHVGRLLVEVQRDVAPLLNRTLTTLEVKVDEDVGTMLANRDLVRRSLSNLVRFGTGLAGQGAMKLTVTHGSDRGTPAIRFALYLPDLQLEEDQVDALVNDFSRSRARQLPQYHGAGLGLVITKGFCQRMGGRFVVQTDEPKGVTLTMLLPPAIQIS